MAKWTIINSGGQIGKDHYFYSNLDLSWLPSDILAVQSPDGVTAQIERGDVATETVQSNESDVAVVDLDWWSNVASTWLEAYYREQEEIAAEEARLAAFEAQEADASV